MWTLTWAAAVHAFAVNGPAHKINQCTEVVVDRYKMESELRLVYKKERLENVTDSLHLLYDCLVYNYFTIDMERIGSSSRRRVLEITQKVIFDVIIKRKDDE